MPMPPRLFLRKADLTELEATNQDGCTGTDEVFVTLYPMPQVELGET